jgi:hypothetical protein
MSGGRITWTKYVVHSEVPRWTALGWVSVTGKIFDPRAANHDTYSHIMEWRGAGEPRYPDEAA